MEDGETSFAFDVAEVWRSVLDRRLQLLRDRYEFVPEEGPHRQIVRAMAAILEQVLGAFDGLLLCARNGLAGPAWILARTVFYGMVLGLRIATDRDPDCPSAVAYVEGSQATLDHVDAVGLRRLEQDLESGKAHRLVPGLEGLGWDDLVQAAVLSLGSKADELRSLAGTKKPKPPLFAGFLEGLIKATEGEFDLSAEYEYTFALMSGAAKAEGHGLRLFASDPVGPVLWATTQVARLAVAVSDLTSDELSESTRELWETTHRAIVRLSMPVGTRPGTPDLH